MGDRYLEDVEVGERHACGTHTVTRDEILEFAERWDPQPFHVDEAAARDSIYGGLIASGWHTASACMRLAVDTFYGDLVTHGSPGVRELEWRAPVRPGDTLSVTLEVREAGEWGPRPEWGVIWSAVTGEVESSTAIRARIGTLLARRDA